MTVADVEHMEEITLKLSSTKQKVSGRMERNRVLAPVLCASIACLAVNSMARENRVATLAAGNHRHTWLVGL